MSKTKRYTIEEVDTPKGSLLVYIEGGRLVLMYGLNWNGPGMHYNVALTDEEDVANVLKEYPIMKKVLLNPGGPTPRDNDNPHQKIMDDIMANGMGALDA